MISLTSLVPREELQILCSYRVFPLAILSTSGTVSSLMSTSYLLSVKLSRVYRSCKSFNPFHPLNLLFPLVLERQSPQFQVLYRQ